MNKRDEERHYFILPVFVKRVVARKTRREIVGWRWEAQNGHGHLLGAAPRLYSTPEQARDAARKACP